MIKKPPTLLGWLGMLDLSICPVNYLYAKVKKISSVFNEMGLIPFFMFSDQRRIYLFETIGSKSGT